MSFPFQRDGSPKSPKSPEYFSGDSSPARLSPAWKGTKKRLLDTSRILQVVGVAVALVVLVALISTFSSKPAVNDEDRSRSQSSRSKNFFVDFEGGLECRINSQELYVPPPLDTAVARRTFPYCSNRANLLQALNGGGRHGFDAPFTPQGCHYKWYSAKEICMILERFDGVVFVGDDLIAQLYAGFNVLLRQNLALGALEQWRMTDKDREHCMCERQFTNPDCSKYFTTSSDQVAQHDSQGGNRSPYACNRVPHFYLPIRGSPAPADLTTKLADLLAKDPHSWKPVPIIHSLGLSTSFQWQSATDSMDEWLTIADGSGRNTPFLWLGPNAAGHLKPPGKILQEGNNALWHYTVEMGKEAVRRGVDNLGLYNMTLQAQSFDGSGYGERVMVTQAMMIANWLAKLETT